MFHVGQMVVCVDSSNGRVFTSIGGLKKGYIYEIIELDPHPGWTILQVAGGYG